MQIIFLGTGTSQGTPIIGSKHPVCLSDNAKDKRLRSSIMITWDNFRYIIDCGTDFRQQMLREHIDRIDGIIFTHEHADHTAGLDDIRPFCHRQGAIPVYVPERMVENLKYRFDYIFSEMERYPGAPRVALHTIYNEPFTLGDKKILPVEFLHGKLPIFGYRIDGFAYLTDFKSISTTEKKKLANLDILIISALRIESHATHLSLEEALLFIETIQPKKAYITHVSHLLGFHTEVEELLPKHVFLAYDGLVLEV